MSVNIQTLYLITWDQYAAAARLFQDGMPPLESAVRMTKEEWEEAIAPGAEACRAFLANLVQTGQTQTVSYIGPCGAAITADGRVEWTPVRAGRQ